MTDTILSAHNLTIRFGGLLAVANLSFDVARGSITSLIGPNGAGKTTVFNMLTGVYQPSSGQLTFENQSLVGFSPDAITKRGMARTFQNIRLFKSLSVLTNLLVAADACDRSGFFSALIALPKFRKRELARKQKARELLSLFQLSDRADDLASELPYGAQRRLEIARALATGARLLLLDEPAAGMNPQETAELMATIRRVRDEFGATILLIEHDMKLVMGISEKIIVLDHGEKIAEGVPEFVRTHPKVIEAYLGRAPKQEKKVGA